MDDTADFLGLFSDHTTYQSFDDSNQNRRNLAKIYTGPLDKNIEKLTALNAQGAGIFFMVNEGDGNGRKNNNVQRITAFFIDMDGAPLSNLDDSPLKPHVLVESSPNKYHAYWVVSNAPLDAFGAVQKELAAKFESDPKVHDLARVMRIPGFQHMKDPGNPYTTEVIHVQNQPAFEYDNFVSTMIGKPIQTKTEEHKPALTGLIPEGSRNTTLFHRACELRAKGLSAADVKRIVVDQATLNGISETEANKIVHSACRYEDNTIHPLTELGNADRFVERYAHIIRYVDIKDRFIEWNDHYWAYITHSDAIDRMVTVVRSIRNEVTLTENEGIQKSIRTWAKKSQSHGVLSSSLKIAKSNNKLRIKPEQLDVSQKLFSAKNYTINLETGEYYEPRPRDLITQHSNVVADPSAECPTWEKTIIEMMDDDKELASFLQRFVGYTLYGGNLEQCIIFLHGDGSNGKSTFLKTLQNVFGGYAVTVDQSLFMKSGKLDSNAPRPDKLRLKGVKYVLCTEVDEDRKLDEGFVKAITGNDTIEARGLYAPDSIEFEPMLTPWVSMNDKPIIRGDGHAIWRRIILIPFERTFEDQSLDPHLPTKLITERPGILNWCVDGCLQYRKNGLQIPEKVKLATNEYRNEMDLLADWLDSSFESDANNRIPYAEFYESYANWCIVESQQAITKRTFYTKVTNRKGITKTRANGSRYVKGLRFREKPGLKLVGK